MKFEMKRGLALLLCLAMVAGVFVGVPGLTTVANAAASNTVRLGDGGNGDFQDAVDTCWTLSNANYVQIVAGAGRNGSSALYINDTGSAGYNAKSTELFEVQPGTSITASVYAKGTHTGAQLYFWWYQEDGAASSTANAGQTWAVSDEWTLTTVTKTVPTDAKYATISLNTGAAATGEVYFDDLSVKGTKVNLAGTNLLGYAAPGNFNTMSTSGVTTTYDEATDTATMTIVSAGSGSFLSGTYDRLQNNGSWNFPANATYAIEFDLDVTDYSAAGTALFWLRVEDKTNSTAPLAQYIKVENDGANHWEFTTGNACSNLQMYIRPRANGQNATFSISNLTVYAKCGDVTNGNFDKATINGWTLVENEGTSWAISEGRNSTQGLALVDNSTTASATIISDYIPVNADYARQRPVGYMGAKATGFTGVTYYYHYYDENYVELKPNETWEGGNKTLKWRAATGTLTNLTEAWGTKALSTGNSYMYIPYGTAYLTIEVRTGAAVADTGTLYIDDIYVNLYCEHVNGTHENPATVAESSLVNHELVAPTYIIRDTVTNDEDGDTTTTAAEGTMAYCECSVCGVKYTDESAATVVTDVTLPAGEVLRNIDQGNSLNMLFALKATDLENMNIDPDNVTADVNFGGESLTGLEVEEYTDATYGTLYRVEFPNISAKEMFDVMTVKFYNGEDVIYTDTHNIRGYANACINDTTGKHSDLWKTACRDLLYYGAAAQTYFGHRLNQLANKDVVASGTTFTATKERTVSVGEDLFIASTIRFQSNLTMNFAVDATSEATTGKITFTNHKGQLVEREVAPVYGTMNSKDVLYFEFDGMVVADVSCDITFTASNGDTVVVQAVDSMDAYINRVLTTSTNENMKALAQAFGNYSTSAYAFLHRNDA